MLWPAAVHLVLVAFLYAWLTVERRAAVSRGQARIGDYRLYETEPLRARLISNNLSNQFELPTLFHPLVLYLHASGQTSATYVALAWIFVLGRLVHAGVHILSPDVALRGNVFTINFIALAAMWALFLSGALFGL